MNATLRIELIGDDFFWHQRHGGMPFQQWLRYIRRFGYNKSNSWVARLTRIDEYGRLQREFLRPVRDYMHANNSGSRGIYAHYVLLPGLYEINQRMDWKQVRRYFAQVTDNGLMVEMTRDEVTQCLNAILE